ncbi:hypothetical protein V1264_017735 [Littorina saxatilis]|uniref:Uncharacterized protein n=1 Tax=Littorina saxatilis TaxID=31220 RepID=A0AAN9BJ07_9CAEN
MFKYRTAGRSIYAEPGPRSQESNYTDLVLHEAVTDTRRAASHENTAANSDYKNTGDKRTPGDDVQYQKTGSASQTESVYENTSHE